MELGHDQFQGAHMLRRVHVYRNAPAVILHPDHIVPLKNYEDLAAKTLHGLVNRVIDNFKNQMMETIDPCGPDIHTGALAYCLKALQNLNVLGRIVGIHPFILVILKEKVKIREY
jgi:hypothetical protein